MKRHLRGLILWTMIGALSGAITLFVVQFLRFMYVLLMAFPGMSLHQQLVFATIALCALTIVTAIALYVLGDD